jgi:multisubunit Na+/H+ antiporter MnhG subunit
MFVTSIKEFFMKMPLLIHLPLFVCAILLFFVAIGIYRSQNALQILHFTTIIEIICIPLALFAMLINIIDFPHTRVLYVIFVAVLISPISSYFIGRKYYKLNNSTEN